MSRAFALVFLSFAATAPFCPAEPVLVNPNPAPPSAASPAAGAALVSESEITFIFEDMTGRPPSRREMVKYRDLARAQRWDRETFRRQFSLGEECRAVTPPGAIDAAFRDLLNRHPTDLEFRMFSRSMETEGWTPGQVRAAIRDTPEYREASINRVIEHAYHELLGHRPDRAARDYYLNQMMMGRLDEDGLYRSIKDSREYRIEIPNAKITRAWRNVLGREPDVRGLERYRRTVYERNLSVEDIERDLKKSPEFSELVTKTINKIYLELMGREVDPKSLEVYRHRMIDQGWSEAKVRDDVKKFPEYKDRQSREHKH